MDAHDLEQARRLVAHPSFEEVLPFPHIACTVAHPEDLHAEARRLLALLQDFAPAEGVRVQATYDPADESAVLFVCWGAPP